MSRSLFGISRVITIQMYYYKNVCAPPPPPIISVHSECGRVLPKGSDTLDIGDYLSGPRSALAAAVPPGPVYWCYERRRAKDIRRVRTDFADCHVASMCKLLLK